jgi:glycosyltransferase involved in cell wall biosynthesis
VAAWKGPDCWIETAQLVLAQRPKAVFRWLGVGDQLDEMRAKVAALGLQNQIVFAGYDSNVAKHLDEAYVYFQPSRIENHSMAVADAMAHGLPCVVSNVGGMPEAVIDGETGFVCPDNDASAFANRIVELLDSPYLRTRMGSAAQHRARALFSEAVQMHSYLDTYQDVMSRK